MDHDMVLVAASMKPEALLSEANCLRPKATPARVRTHRQVIVGCLGRQPRRGCRWRVGVACGAPIRRARALVQDPHSRLSSKTQIAPKDGIRPQR